MTDLPTLPSEALAARRERLVDACQRAGLGVVLVTRPEHVRYLTGSDGPAPRAVVLRGGRTTMIAPSATHDGDSLARQGIDLVTFRAYAAEVLIDPAANLADTLGSVVRSMGSSAIGYDFGGPPRLETALRSADLVDAEPIFARVRRPRDRWEVAEIRASVEIVEAGLVAARQIARPGYSELDISLAAAAEMTARLGQMVTLDHTIGSGPRSATSDPHATSRVISGGDLVIVDLYPALRGYFADLTRTWSIGSASADAHRMHDAVLSALRAGEGRLEPGSHVAVVDAAVREALGSAGDFAASMGHHSGHGLGIFAWEHPWVGAGSDETLEPGDVVALEPGTYRPGFGGIRIEGNYLITDGGFERLDSLEEGLVA